MGRILLNKILRGIFWVVLTGDMTNIHVVLNELSKLFYYRFPFFSQMDANIVLIKLIFISKLHTENLSLPVYEMCQCLGSFGACALILEMLSTRGEKLA